MSTSTRLEALSRLYDELAKLPRFALRDLAGHKLPSHGVYFIFDESERRSDSGDGARIVRVGTHALTSTSSATLTQRLSNHRGSIKSGGGNHRGSIFRLLLGEAVFASGDIAPIATWGKGSIAPRDVRAQEHYAEQAVSDVLANLQLTVLAVPDREKRAHIETNAIALLSNFQKPSLDTPSSTWLGNHSPRPKVRASGLWNIRDVDAGAAFEFLDDVAMLVRNCR
jgi:hypothetical protein